MLIMWWFSGDQETREAMTSGKRYIITIANGRIEGSASILDKEGDKSADNKNGDNKDSSLPAAEGAEAEQEVKVQVGEVQRSASPIAEVNEELLENKGSGISLPRVSDSNVRSLYYYAKRHRRPDESPMIAIVITGLGHSKKATDAALALDERVGLSFSPYAAGLSSWAAASRLSGHEFYLDLPLQTVGYPADDPGNYSITLARGNDDNMKHLHWAMSRVGGYVGLIAPPGEVITNSADSFKPLRDDIAKRGLMMLFGNSFDAQSLAASGKKDEKTDDKAEDSKPEEVLTSIRADIWIDEELTEMSMQARLAMLEQIAQRNGYAVGIARSYPLSISQIKQWREGLETRGSTLTPLSFVAKLYSK